MAISTKALKKLQSRLPGKYLEAAQNKLKTLGRDVSDSYVSQVRGGNRFDLEILMVLTDVADEHQADLEKLEARMMGATPAN